MNHLLSDRSGQGLRPCELKTVKSRVGLNALWFGPLSRDHVDRSTNAAKIINPAYNINQGHLRAYSGRTNNITLDKRRHQLEVRKIQLTKGIPLLHQKSIDVAIRQFCHTAKLRFDKAADFDAKRQF